MRFRTAEPPQVPSHAIESRLPFGSPQPSIVSPTTSLTNRRPGNAFSASQRSWSPLSWTSTSSPLSQSNMATTQWPPQTHVSSTAYPTSKSASPGPGVGQSLRSQLLQSNLFIAQDVARTSEPPTSWRSHSSSSTRPGGVISPLFFDHAQFHGEDATPIQGRRAGLSPLYPPAASLQQHRPPSVLSDTLSQGRTEVDDYASLMPPPRQLPYAKKTKTPGVSGTPAADTSETAPKHTPKKRRSSPSGARSVRSKKHRKDPEPAVFDHSQTTIQAEMNRPEQYLAGKKKSISVYRDAEAQADDSGLHPKASTTSSLLAVSALGVPQKTGVAHLSQTEPANPPRRPGLRSGKLRAGEQGDGAAEQFRDAKIQTVKSTKNRGASCDIRTPQASSSTQAEAVMITTGTSTNAVTTRHHTTQTGADPECSGLIDRGRHVDSHTQTVTANTMDSGNGCNIRTWEDSIGTLTEHRIADRDTQTEPSPSLSDSGKLLDGEMMVAAFRLINEARELMYSHVDDDLDQMERGSEVDVVQSMGSLLCAVENLAQNALDAYGPAMLEIPFALMARDYLKNREVPMAI